MTKEEAMVQLKTIRNDCYIISSDEDKQAFDMAIKALEQEPCEDCISRQAVLNEIDRYIEKVQSTGAKDDFISFSELVVKELPPVTPKSKTDVLDKIRAEIMDTGAYEQEVNGNTEFLKGINYCLCVIDKYKAESEDKR